MWQFSVSDSFAEEVEKFSPVIQESIKLKLRYLSRTSNPLSFPKRLQGYHDIYRFRVGDFRIVFRLVKREIILLTVRHRKEVYKWL